ncbi:MAG: DivIVA domain-containing protein, partial [bacterium]
MGLKEKLEELASKQYRRVARGLDPSEVEFAIRQVADLAQELIQRNEAMEKELVEFREQEGWMKRTLLHAEKIASAIQGEAAIEATTIRAKAEIEAAEVVDQSRKKAEVQERVLISRRILVEKRMALYEHESNL